MPDLDGVLEAGEKGWCGRLFVALALLLPLRSRLVRVAAMDDDLRTS
jgi:hypothetical protein